MFGRYTSSMVLDTTYYNKEHKQLFDNFVGKPYTFFEAFKRRGVGSKRMIVDKVSPNLNSILNTVSDLNYANIEMRKEGILIHITKGQRNFTWAIPFYHLVFYKIDGMSIHAQGRFIHFKKSKSFDENKKFLKALIDEKIQFDERYKLPIS